VLHGTEVNATKFININSLPNLVETNTGIRHCGIRHCSKGERSMYEDSHEEVGVFDFDEFADHLLDQAVLASPSQLHGCLSGLLCAGAPAEGEFGLDAMTQALDLVLHGELASRTMQLYTVTNAALRDEDFTFGPLLPGDDEDIATRTAALASWCDGFLAGFAYLISAEENSGPAVSPDASEVLRDIGAIAQAEVTDDETEDEAEGSYMELVEYLRAAVANVFMGGYSSASDTSPSPESEQPIH
jgi:uncharacterized protein YgfB (UPF0149 family)